MNSPSPAYEYEKDKLKNPKLWRAGQVNFNSIYKMPGHLLEIDMWVMRRYGVRFSMYRLTKPLVVWLNFQIYFWWPAFRIDISLFSLGTITRS